mgnify:CR=1 FL=1
MQFDNDVNSTMNMAMANRQCHHISTMFIIFL